MPTVPKIVIDQQLAELGVRSTPAQMHIEMQQPKMTIKTEPPQMEIERKNPSFKINRKRISSESGPKPAVELSKSYRNTVRAGALKGAKTAGDDGDLLGNVRKSGDRVAKLANAKTVNAIMKKHQTGNGLMPKTKPEVVWDKGYLRINWSKHSIVIDWEGDYMPQMTVDPPYSIEVFLRTKPYFRILVEEGEDPYTPGRHVNRAI